MTIKTAIIRTMIFSVGLSITTTSTAEPNKPLALRGIMQEMGKEMQVVTDAIGREDWPMVAQAASNIADHPRPPLTEKIKIMAFIGSDAVKLKNHDKQTHDAARVVQRAATQKQGQGVIDAFATLQKTCLSCHQHFRQSIQNRFYKQK